MELENFACNFKGQILLSLDVIETFYSDTCLLFFPRLHARLIDGDKIVRRVSRNYELRTLRYVLQQ